MSGLVHTTIRRTHWLFRRGDLPDRIAIYFHELEPETLAAFRDAVGHLLDAGYRTVSPADYVDPQTPGKLLFLSFDDNFDHWHGYLDTFADLGATATFYVNSGVFSDVAGAAEIRAYFERIRYHGAQTTLSTSQLREIAEAGHTIGCHTHTHPMLSKLPAGRWPDEILGSKATLEDILGRAVTDFSYPFGMRRHFTEPLRRYCTEVGFRTIATALPGLLYAPCDPHAVHRTGWTFGLDLESNLKNLRIDARFFVELTGRSAIG